LRELFIAIGGLDKIGSARKDAKNAKRGRKEEWAVSFEALRLGRAPLRTKSEMLFI
jgi:hypothetical protein